MELMISPSGEVRCIYTDEFNLSDLGPLAIRRASHVEPDSSGNWCADLRPVDGPVLGPFRTRSEALQAEVEWLRRHWLLKSGTSEN